MDKLQVLISKLQVVDPSLTRWIKWVIPLLIGRVSNPFWWASFLSLNSVIRRKLLDIKERVHINRYWKGCDVAKVSNVITCLFLYKATGSNGNFPKDYALLYLWLTYYGSLNRPSASNIVVSPKYSPYLKLKSYKNEHLHKLYENKEFIIFPLIFGQILSNYLTPTKYKLNQRYLSSSIKLRILNPIWINYTLGVRSHSMKWAGLFKSYVVHNAAIALVVGLMSLKKRIVDRYNTTDLSTIVKNYLVYVFHCSNSFTNFIYGPNLISILLISLTSRLVSLKSSSYHNNKLLFKSYIKVIGFIAGFTTLYANAIGLVPEYGSTEQESPRKISKTFLNGLNLYMFRLIVLSKWRIVKENHPYFRVFKLHTWNKVEALVMCFGFYKIMNLRDFINNNEKSEVQELKNDSLIKMAEKIMN